MRFEKNLKKNSINQSKSLQDLFNNLVNYLKELYIENHFYNDPLPTAHADAFEILNALEGIQMTDIMLSSKRDITESLINQIEKILYRIESNEPLPYILSRKHFWNNCFTVNNSTLIPRSDSEVLVEASINIIIQYLYKYKQIYKKEFRDKLTIIDLCSGSGCILLSIASSLKNHIPNIDLYGAGFDISKDANAVAIINSKEIAISEYCKFYEANICDIANFFSYFDNILSSNKRKEKVDLIVSNPPYIDVSTYENLHRSVKEYEPRNALTDNADGLNLYSPIFSIAREKLSENGRLIIEICSNRLDDIIRLCTESKMTVEKILMDLGGLPRALVIHRS